MSLTGWGHFLETSISDIGGKVKIEKHTNLPKEGQADGVGKDQRNTKYPVNQGWFKVISVEFEGAGVCDVSAGVSVGNVTESCVRLLKYTGENTPFAWEALYRRCIFDFELVLMGRHGQKENEEQINIRFRGGVLRKYKTITGDPKKGIGATATLYSDTDTAELDQLEIVFQSADIKAFTKEGIVSVHGVK